MKRRTGKILCASISAAAMGGFFVAPESQAGVVTLGDLAVFEGAAFGTLGNTAASINIIELSPTTANQATPVQTISAPTNGAGTLFTSGPATSVGLLRLSSNGALLSFTGHTSAGAGNINTVTSRAVATIDANGVYSIAANYFGASGNQTRSASSADGTTYYIGDQGGIYSNNGTASLAGTLNVRGVTIFNNQSYAGQAASTTSTASVSSLSPALPQSSPPVTLTSLPGVPNNANASDYFFLARGSQGANPDSLYIAEGSVIAKFSFDGTNWISRGTGILSSVYGLIGRTDSNGVATDLFATTNNGSTNAAVVSLVDSAAFDATISLSAATTLYKASSAGTNFTFQGIAFVPTAAPEPTSFGLIALGGAMLLGRRRRVIAEGSNRVTS